MKLIHAYYFMMLYWITSLSTAYLAGGSIMANHLFAGITFALACLFASWLNVRFMFGIIREATR